ncbi:M10 family metallopeptidase C-terminal domain-containing protein [Rhizobium sp.]
MAKFIKIDASALKSFDYATFLADYYSTTGTGQGTAVWADSKFSEFAEDFSSGNQWNINFDQTTNDRSIVIEGDDMKYDFVVDGTKHGYSGTITSIEFAYKYSQTGYDQIDGVSRTELYNLGEGLKISGLDVSTEYGTGFSGAFWDLYNDLRRGNSTSSTFIDDLYAAFESKAQYFVGSRNADTYVGTEFDDKIVGGKGQDTLSGGDGKDLFVFAKGDTGKTYETADDILDFVRGEDRINLSSIDANTGKKGNQDFTWIGDKDFSGKAGQLKYEVVDGHTYVSGDWNGDKNADFMIDLTGEFKLYAGSFVL